MLELIDALVARPCEQVFIRSRDGLRLAARYYHCRDGAPLEIQFHGYRGSAIRDFCGGAAIALAAGHNVLLVDQRAHGKSEGRTICFGVKERFDCLDWVDYALRRFGPDARLLLCGVSMGASTVLMAGGLPLPEQVKVIIADCPYSSPMEIIRKVCRDLRLPPRLMEPFLRLAARLYGGFSLTGASALEALRQCRVPVLLIHGEDDRFVPCQMSRDLRDACAAPVQLLTVPGAGHGLSFIVDRPAYEQAVARFVAQALGDESG